MTHLINLDFACPTQMLLIVRSSSAARYKVEAQGSWERLTSAEYRDSYALGSLGDTLYLLGGLMKLKNQLLITNCVERWSLQGGPWRSAAPLPLPLAYHSVVRMKDRLYVMGGRTPQVIFTRVLASSNDSKTCNQFGSWKIRLHELV